HNFYGQLGDGSTNERTTPVSAVLSGGAPLTNVMRVAAGSGFSLAVRGDGAGWAWGQNKAGPLGDGTTNNRSNPQQIAVLSSVVDAAAGEDHSLARDGAGLVFGWGGNLYGQVGTGPSPQLTPVQIPVQPTLEAGYGSSISEHTDG